MISRINRILITRQNLGTLFGDGTPMKIQNIVNYNISVSSPSEGRPRFKKTQCRTGKGAMIIADLVQKEYDKLNSIKNYSSNRKRHIGTFTR